MDNTNNAGIEHSPAIGQIAVALNKFHKSLKKIIKKDTNPFFKSKYAGLPSILDAVEDPLLGADLTFIQCPIGKYGLETILMHKSGEYFKSRYFMEPTIHIDKQTKKEKPTTPQDMGSAITYQRRYALVSILGLNVDDDDDGNGASGKDVNHTNQKQIDPKIEKAERDHLIKQVKTLWADLLKAGFKTDKKTKNQLDKFIKNIDKEPLSKIKKSNDYLALQYKNIGLENNKPGKVKKDNEKINKDISNLYDDIGYKNKIDKQNFTFGMFRIDNFEDLSITDKNKLKTHLVEELEKINEAVK